MWTPNVSLVGPGGAKSLLFIGAFKRLFEEKCFLKDLHTWVGISAGAAISLLIVIGYTIDEIIDICMEINLVDDIISINLDEARTKMGLIKNKTVEDKLKECIENKFNYVPNLLELYNIKKVKLVLVTYNLDSMKPEFLDYETEPNLSCLEAAMMSMAVPLLMQPRKYKGNIYLDGAIGAPYPILKFDNPGNRILGMYISSEQDLYCPDKKPMNYLYRLIQAGMKTLRDNEIKFSSKNAKHIALETDVRDTTGLTINQETRQNLVNQGYQCAEAFLKINKNPEKYQLNLTEEEEIPFE